MTAQLQTLADHIAASQAANVVSHAISFDELTLITTSEALPALLTFLRDDEACAFQNFICLCGADYLEREKRFDVVYQLQSLTKNHRIRVKLMVDDKTAVPSIIDIYAGALWFERETYDMYGVLFSGHPDMRRLLTDYGFEGYPLRKDFPLTGYVEVRYDDAAKRVVYEPVKLAQEFRDFDFLSPWEGADYLPPANDKEQVKP